MKWLLLTVVTIISLFSVTFSNGWFIQPSTTQPARFLPTAPPLSASELFAASVDTNTCRKAIKILTQYERLAEERNIHIPPNRLIELNRLRDEGIITSNDLPGTLQHEFPGQFMGKTLNEIRKLCSKSR